jgi:hypothetical protein
MTKDEMTAVLEGQFKLLAELNKDCEPEQVRKNIETMLGVYYALSGSLVSVE